MTTETPFAAAPTEQAFFDSPPPSIACSSCGGQAFGEYFMAGDSTVCASCATSLRAGPPGSRLGRVARAMLFGSGAAFAGWAVYYGVLAATDSQWGILAIGVGLGVGKAVMLGSGGRGGRGYQALAMGLTYMAIALSYMPMIVQGLVEGAGGDVFWPLAIIIGFVLSLAAPFAMIADAPIAFAILLFGLWEAWKLNQRVELVIDGPYLIRAPETPTEATIESSAAPVES